MDDLISRQEAIEALFKLYEYQRDIDPTEAADLVRQGVYLAEKKIEQLPSAQPEPCEDTISRQAAIEIASGFCHPANIAKELAKLPSAQPERICVNCGRTANNGGWYADGGTRCPIEEHYALPKDGFCHLWEKRNVTDDDYPERRTDERTD